jgi:hypothetical protein
VASVAGVAVLADWSDLEREAPAIARLGAARLNAVRVAMLGTLRRDGSPRISPIEPHIVTGHLLIGTMTWSKKAHDLLRDPRYTLHSVVSDPDIGEGELKVRGLSAPAGPDLRTVPVNAWWAARPADQAFVFRLRITIAMFIAWDTERGLMTIHRWSPRDGYRQVTHGYP